MTTEVSAAQSVGTAPSAPSAITASQTTEEFSQFLELLVAQVENQDPLEPLDSTAFVEQLATFSSLEQQVQTNDLLSSILEAVRAE